MLTYGKTFGCAKITGRFKYKKNVFGSLLTLSYISNSFLLTFFEAGKGDLFQWQVISLCIKKVLIICLFQ